MLLNDVNGVQILHLQLIKLWMEFTINTT